MDDDLGVAPILGHLHLAVSGNNVPQTCCYLVNMKRHTVDGRNPKNHQKDG